MTKVDDIFRRAAARNRSASIEAEKTRKPLPVIDWEARDAADKEIALDRFETDETEVETEPED